MTLERRRLVYLIPAQAVYYVLRRPLEKDAFLWALEALRSRASADNIVGNPERHWHAIEARVSSESRWDRVVELPDEALQGIEAMRRNRASIQNVSNILQLRPFSGYTINGLQYTVDVFNPANELEMPYAGAGEPVLALLMRGLEPEPGPIALRLAENTSFYEILKDLDGILQPEHVCGTYSMMSVLSAYLEGRVDPGWRPWDFFFPLHVLKDPPIPLTPETRISGRLVGMLPGKEVKLAKAEDWGGGRVLIQVNPGLDAALSWEYFAVAKALGMTPVQQLVEGSAPPRAERDAR